MIPQNRRVPQAPTIPHIGIVGAGASGLRCADILLQHGLKVTILEGRDRIGGRLWQRKLPSGYMVDEGPNWFHGTVNNPLLDIAKETGTVTKSWGEDTTLFDEDGELLSEDEAREYMGVVWGIILEGFQYSIKNTQTIHPDESLHDFFLKKVQEKFPISASGDNERKQKIVMQISQMWGAYVGGPVEKQSLKYFWLEECLDGGESPPCSGACPQHSECISGEKRNVLIASRESLCCWYL
jgi:hypothetical protein